MAQQPSKASSASREAVTSLIGSTVEARGFVLEDVTITPAGKRRVVRVVVDLPSGPGSLDLDAVAAVAREVSQLLDAAEDEATGRGPLGGAPYVLEVTSPGVDRPLTEPRHWSRATDRLVRTTVAGQELTARVLDTDDATVRLRVDRVGKNEVPSAERVVAWAELGPGAVQVEFNRRQPDGAADPHDADPHDTDVNDEED